jgi:hypothetical protein
LPQSATQLAAGALEDDAMTLVMRGAAAAPLTDPKEETSQRFNHVAPAGTHETLPMVGIGGSAGSIRALKAFFGAMP